MRAKFVPVVQVPSLSVFGQKEFIPDWLNTTYVSKIKALPVSQKMVLAAKYVPYPDLLSYDLYGTTDYWWVLCMYNGVVRIFADMTEGTLWKIPALSDIQSMLSAAGSPSGSNLVGSNVVI